MNEHLAASSLEMDDDVSKAALWRRQLTRNLMDCYALGLETSGAHPGDTDLKELMRLMLEGITSIKDEGDAQAFYTTAAKLCRKCAEAGGEKAGLFRIYGAIFEDLSGKEG